MQTAQSGIQGGTPALAVKPVDATLPTCDKLTPDGACTRKQGHYGACGVAK